MAGFGEGVRRAIGNWFANTARKAPEVMAEGAKQPGLLGTAAKIGIGTTVGGTLIGAGAAINSAISGPDSLAASANLNLQGALKNPDAVSDVDNMFTRIARIFQNLMKLVENFPKIMKGEYNALALFSGNNGSPDVPPVNAGNTPPPSAPTPGLIPGLSGTLERAIPNGLDGGNSTLATVEAGALTAGGLYAANRTRGMFNSRASVESVADAGSHLKGKAGVVAGIAALGAAGATYLFGTSSAEAAPVASTPESKAMDTANAVVMPAVASMAALEAAKGGTMIAREGLMFAGKRVPIVGGVLTLAFSAYSAGSMALNGEWGRAGAELTTGTAEALVNTTGLGLLGGGDAVREGLRAGFTSIAGETVAPDKSGLRQIAEYATGTGDFAPQPRPVGM